MASQRDYYEVLGIVSSADEVEIKRAYRKLAIEFHPDRNQGSGEAEIRFREASEAYSVLSDATRRTRYDRVGHAAFTGNGESHGSGFEPVDFSSFGDVLETLIGDMFGGRGKGRKPRDLRYDLHIRFEEAALGCTKTVALDRPMLCGGCKGTGAAPGHVPPVCEACRGKGEVRFQRGLLPATRPCQACKGRGHRIDKACPQCDGVGTRMQRSELEVSLPAGVDDQSVRSIRGGGEQTPRGDGDLHIYVHVKDHPLFERDGADLRCTIPIAYPQAVLGDQLDIPTLEGRVTMRLPAGTESGKVFRLRGKGMPVFGGVGKGDQLVKVVIEVPSQISERERELLQQLSDEMGDAAGLPDRRSFLGKLRSLFGTE